METYDYDKALLEAVRARLAPDVSTVWFIMDVLSIGKEAAYRRLRGEVSLSLRESVLLANKLGISLSEVTNRDPTRIYNYRIYLMDFETPEEADYRVLQAYLDNLSRESGDPFSQLAVTTNVFPRQLYLRYPAIVRYSVFKWIHQSGKSPLKAYHEVRVADRLQQVFRDSRQAYLGLKTTYYLFDHQLCRSLVHGLRYFSSVGLLREEDREAIRSEACKLLDYMERIAVEGQYENGNPVYMYVSDLHFNKSFYNVRSGEYRLSLIKACVLNYLYSRGRDCYDKMNNWIHSRRRLSTLISQSAEPRRIAFFNELRRQLDEL